MGIQSDEQNIIAARNRQLAAKDLRIKELEAALKPFADCHCKPYGRSCGCHNCVARRVLDA